LPLEPIPTEQVYFQRNDFICNGTSLFDVYTEGRIKEKGEREENALLIFSTGIYSLLKNMVEI